MENALFDQLRKKYLLRQAIFFLAVMVILYALVYYPLYLQLSTNVAWSGSLLLFFLTEFVEPLLSYVFYWGIFAFVLYVCVHFSLRDGIPFWIAYAVGAILRYVIQIIVYLTMMGAASLGENFSFFDFLFSVGVDLLFMVVIVFVVWRMQNPNPQKNLPPLTDGISFSGFFERNNRFLRLVLFAALLPAAARLLSRIYYDIYWIVGMGEAVQTIGEVFLMITYYVADCISGGIGYLGMALAVSAFRVSEARAKIKFDEPF